jgi:hypothetical protein
MAQNKVVDPEWRAQRVLTSLAGERPYSIPRLKTFRALSSYPKDCRELKSTSHG